MFRGLFGRPFPMDRVTAWLWIRAQAARAAALIGLAAMATCTCLRLAGVGGGFLWFVSDGAACLVAALVPLALVGWLDVRDARSCRPLVPRAAVGGASTPRPREGLPGRAQRRALIALIGVAVFTVIAYHGILRWTFWWQDLHGHTSLCATPARTHAFTSAAWLGLFSTVPLIHRGATVKRHLLDADNPAHTSL